MYALTILLVTVAYVTGGMDKAVYFSLIISEGDNGSFDTRGAIPSIDIALEAIRDRQLLPGYNLTYEKVQNSKCTRTDALDVFFQDTHESAVTKIAIIGCGCSTATVPVAEISHYWNITQISYAAASSSLSNRKRFRHYFRTNPSFATYSPSIIGVLNKYKWRQLAFLTQNHGTFLKIVSDVIELQQKLQDGTSEFCCFDFHDIHIENEVYDTTNDSTRVAGQLFDQGNSHIFLVNGFSRSARRIICEASKRDLVYPHYGWIMFGWYPKKWWTLEVAEEIIDCSDEELESFLERARPLFIQLLPQPDDYDATTDAGFSTREFIHTYLTRIQQYPYDISPIFMIAFDAVWTIAHALNRTEQMRIDNIIYDECRHLPGELVPLNVFNYSNALMGCIIKTNFQLADFEGVSGQIRYDSSGTIVYTQVRWAQQRLENDALRTVRFGYLNTESNFSMVYEEGENDKTVYPGDFPPDGTPLSLSMTYHSSLFIVYYFITLCGITLSATFLVFNFIFRNKKVVRLTTPSLNYLIISGALLMYLSVIIGVLPSTQEPVVLMHCIVDTWLYGIGYLLMYGTILAKMWRVYQIFHNPNPNKTILRTWHLVVVVIGISGLGALLILSRSVAYVKTHPYLVKNIENPEGKTSSDIHVKYSVWQCYDPGSVPFFFDLIIFIYLSLLQLVGIILAFQTRKVKIPVLNDSKSVTALVYISSIILVVIVLIKYILRGYLNSSAAVFNGGIIVLATFFLVITFVPKMYHLYHDPTGKNVFSGLDPLKSTEPHEVRQRQNSTVVASMTELEDTEKVVLLSTSVARLIETLDIKNKRIAELEAIVNTSTTVVD